MTFGFLVGSRNFCRLFWVSWEVFVSHGYDCIHYVAKSCTHHGISMIVPRFAFFTRIFVFRCDQVSKMIRSGHDCASTSSARSPCNFSSQADVTTTVLREVRKDTVLNPSLVPLLLAAPLVIHEKSWESIDVVEHSYPPDSL